MKKCVNCHNNLNPGQKQCHHCGTVQPENHQNSLLISLVLIFIVIIFMIYNFYNITKRQETNMEKREENEVKENNNSYDKNNSSNNSNNSNNNTNTNYDTSMFKEITMSDFIRIFNNPDDEIRYVYTGRPTCSYCVQFIPILNNSLKVYNYSLYYLDVTYVTESQYKEVIKYDQDLADSFMSTPMVYKIRNGKVINYSAGYKDYADYFKYLENNGIKKR